MPPHQATLRRLAARITLWQAAAAAILLAPGAATARAAVTVGAAALIAATAVPVGGRTGDQWLAARRRFRHRTRRHERRTVSPVEAVVAGVETRGHADRAGNRVGLVADGPAWTAVFRLDPIIEADLVPRLQDLLGRLWGSLGSGDRGTEHATLDVRVAAAQLVGWSVPTAEPGPGLSRTFWIAVRFSPALDPAAVRLRGGGEQGATRAAGAAALRLASDLRGHGFRLRVLDGTELTGELGTSLGVQPPRRGGTGEPVTAAGPPPPVRETWHALSVGALHHACFRPRSRPHSARWFAVALTAIASPPAITTCSSVLVTRDGLDGRTRTESVIRVAVPAERRRRAIRRAVRRAAAGLPARLVPMHGEHHAGVRATIPLARSLRSSPTE